MLTGDDELQAVMGALANPTRRRLLDLLRSGPRTTGALAESVEGLSRYAVMQHLDVLADAGLVLVRREGRQRFNHLNPVPLRRVYERWVSRLAGDAATELLALERHIERTDMTDTTDTTHAPAAGTTAASVLQLEAELRFRTTPERLFRAMTTETQSWFPYTYGEDRVKRLVLEERVGGQVYEDWGDGAGHFYGTVVGWDPPRTYALRSRLHPGTTMDTRLDIEADGDECILRMQRVVVGPLTDDHVAGIRFHGDLARFEADIRAVVEDAA